MSTDVTTTRWLDEREQASWRNYLQMSNQLSAHLARCMTSKNGLSDGDYTVLVNLSEADGGRMRAFELAKQILWEKSRLSHQLTRMQGRGLVAREECPSDARGAFIVLTEAGRQAVEEAAPRHVEDVRKAFIDVLTPEQLDALDSITAAVLAAMEPQCERARLEQEQACTASADSCDPCEN